MEALYFISDKTKKIKIDAEKNLSWIKPKPIQKYIKTLQVNKDIGVKKITVAYCTRFKTNRIRLT